MASKCVFDDLVGQERVAAFLKRAVSDGTVSHAYLFVGPPGTGKKSTARALACALMCDDGGCGACRECRQVRAGSHPDVRYFEPEGSEYVVRQVREEMVHWANQSPVQGKAQVFVLGSADALNDSAANAFLKTLEEPPEHMYFVLTANVFAEVIPTIVSRCQVVRFDPVTPSAAVGLLAERTGVGREDAMAALAASAGVVPRALEFLRSPARREVRERLLGVLRDLPVMDGQDVLVAARELLVQAKTPLEDVKERHDAELRERIEFLGKTAGSMAQVKERQKRELSAREREAVGEVLSVTETWLRDALASSEGAVGSVANSDVADDVAEAGSCAGAAACMQALAAVATARKRISYNVSPQLAVEAMLFDIQEALRCPR